MKNKTIAILESRFGDHVADLVSKQGGIPLRAPALAEEPDTDDAAIAALVEDLARRPASLAIFQTGVGTRALFDAADRLGITGRLLALLADCTVAVRGPKPTAVLRGRGVRIDLSADDPYTTTEVLQAVGDVAIAGGRVLVQRYGETNAELEKQLKARGAEVVEVPTYRWAMPRDTAPLSRLVDALERGEVDAAVFTSASQVGNLFAVAEREGRAGVLRQGLNAALVASIGPVCSRALQAQGIRVSLEAHPPKLGPLMTALGKAFG